MMDSVRVDHHADGRADDCTILAPSGANRIALIVTHCQSHENDVVRPPESIR